VNALVSVLEIGSVRGVNGGFALKLACNPAAAIQALDAVVRDEGCTIEAMPGHLVPVRPGEPPVMVGVGTHKGATVLALPAAIDSPEVLGGLGEALIARLGCAGCVVVDSDEGKDVIRGWNGGEALTAHTGWFAWDAPANRCFAIGLPPHATAAPSGLAAEL